MIHTSPGASTTIGDGVTIGHSCIIYGCTVGDNALIGKGTILLDGCNIGKNTIIGAGSLVTNNTIIPDGCMAFGRPAKALKRPWRGSAGYSYQMIMSRTDRNSGMIFCLLLRAEKRIRNWMGQ